MGVHANKRRFKTLEHNLLAESNQLLEQSTFSQKTHPPTVGSTAITFNVNGVCFLWKVRCIRGLLEESFSMLSSSQ